MTTGNYLLDSLLWIIAMALAGQGLGMLIWRGKRKEPGRDHR